MTSRPTASRSSRSSWSSRSVSTCASPKTNSKMSGRSEQRRTSSPVTSQLPDMADAHQRPDGRPRVVVTGVGAVTPSGADAETTFENVLAARPTATPITEWDTTDHPVTFASSIPDFDPETVVDAREARRIDRASLIGLAAAEEALADAGLGDETAVDPARVAVMIGSGVGGILTLEDQITTRVERGVRRVSP